MKFFLGLFLLLSSQVYASTWWDLELGKQYELTQTLSLKQTERSGAQLDIMAGDKFFLADVIPLDMIKVMLYEFHYIDCPGGEMQTEMEIIPVQGTNPVVEIGALLEEGCVFQVFIEAKDTQYQSFFK